MRNLFLVGLMLFSLSCTNSGKENQQSTEELSVAENTNTLEVTYVNATVYAGKTDYEFADASGKQIMHAHYLLHPEDADDERTNFELPDNMLEDTDDLPGPNPELVGKKFRLHYDQDNKLTKLELIE